MKTLSYLVAALLFSCGGDASPPSTNKATPQAAPTPKPTPKTEAEGCKLLTAEDTAATLGVAVKPGKGRSKGCDWKSKEPLGAVTIDMLEPAAAKMLKKEQASIPGLGDDAFFLTSSSQFVVLVVISPKGSFNLSVQFPIKKPATISNLEETAKQLAGNVLKKM